MTDLMFGLGLDIIRLDSVIGIEFNWIFNRLNKIFYLSCVSIELTLWLNLGLTWS